MKIQKYIALSLTLLLAGCSVFQSETPTASKTSTARAARGDLVLGLSADGSITLPVTGLDFSVSGIIKNIYVSTGDTVKAGDLLAELDDSDLQLALKSAQNNLEKAQLAYEEAVLNAAYSLQSETMNLESTKQKLSNEFDSYTYQLSIDTAELTLERRKQDYADSELSTTQSETAARLTLSRRESDLADAKKTLDKLLAEEEETFDDFNHQNSITTAETNLARAKKNLDDAKKDLTQLQNDYKNANTDYENAKRNYETKLRSYDTLINFYASNGMVEELEALNLELNREKPSDSTLKAARDALDLKEKSINTAQNTYDDAERALKIAKESLDRESTNYEENENEKRESAIEIAEKNVTQSQQSVDDAKTSLEKTLIEKEQKLASENQSVNDAERQLANAKEDLARGEKKYNDDQRDIQNTYKLQSLKVENLSQSDLTIKNALFNIEDAKNKLETAENNLSKIRITAPIDGEVLNVTKRVGEKVSESEGAPTFFMGSGSTSNSLITLRDMSEIYITANIPEGDIVGLSVGQAIRMDVDALGDENIYATVYSISSVPNQDSSGIVTYQVVGILDEFNENIRDKMSVFLTFIKREIKDVILIPNRAIFMEDGQQYVYIDDNGNLEKRAVSCGFSNGAQTEVQQGVQPGETVVVGRVNQ